MVRPPSQLVRPFVEFIFPPTCFGCDGGLSGADSRVCAACWASMRRVTPDEQLYTSMLHRLTSGGDVSALISTFIFEKDGVLQNIIHQLKYNGASTLGVALGRVLGEQVSLSVQHSDVRGVVPVPLHRTKTRERGYNQSLHICRGVSEVTGLEMFPGLLERVRYTRSQTTLSVEERQQNVDGAFAVSTDAMQLVKDSAFIVIDDVITTGATILSCARALRACGSTTVIACSAALAE
jgi:ComF family protein